MTRLVALRGEDPPDDAVVVVRSGVNGLAPETIRRMAADSFDEFGFYGVSVFLALDARLDELCAAEPISRYSMIRVSAAGRVRAAGFALLATGRRPHFDIVLPDLDDATLVRLDGVFDPPTANPGRM